MGGIYKAAFLDRFLFHTRTVQDNMIILENNLSALDLKIKPFQLLERSLKHDLDKLKPNLVDTYVEFTKYHYYKDRGKEYKFNKEKCLKKAQLHYKTQRHHFYKNNKIPNIIDICEMCCDVTAISIEKNEENNLLYYKNVMLKEYEDIKKYNDIILYIFNNLWKLLKNFTYDNEEKYLFIKNRMEKIRKFQDAMMFLEKNLDKLAFKIEDYEIVRRALDIGKDKLHGDDCSFFDDKKENLDILDVCVFCCDCFIKRDYDPNFSVDLGNDFNSFNIYVKSLIKTLERIVKKTH